MSKQNRTDRARDELFSHIHRCGVLQATVDDQDTWMTETIEYLAERYPDLDVPELTRLKGIGMQFCKPVIDRLTRETPAAPKVPAEVEAPEEAAPAQSVGA